MEPLLSRLAHHTASELLSVQDLQSYIMCRSYTYYWVACSHVTFEVRKCQTPENCPSLDSVPNTSTELQTFCHDCHPIIAQDRGRNNRQRSGGFNESVARNFTANRRRTEQADEARQEAARIQAEEQRRQTAQREDLDRRYILRQANHLTAIPADRLTNSQRRNLSQILVILRRSAMGHTMANIDRYIRTIPTQDLPRSSAMIDPLLVDPADALFTELIAQLGNGEEHLRTALTQLQMHRRIERGGFDYAGRRYFEENVPWRHKRVAAICKLWQRLALTPEIQHDPDCTICREPLGQGHDGVPAEYPRSLPCGHVFGTMCIQTWLQGNSSCPTCRRDYGDFLSNEQNQHPPADDGLYFELEDFQQAILRSDT